MSKVDLRPFKCRLLKGAYPSRCEISYKIDGVMAIRTVDGWVSRNGKPLYNLPQDKRYSIGSVVEVYLGSFKDSISAVHTHNGKLIDREHIYTLFPRTDCRLAASSPDLTEAIRLGYEGLIVHDIDTDIRYKQKPTETYDVEVLRIIPGKGKNIGKVGALVTEMGNVGTGLTDAGRVSMMYNIVGKTIEVECMHLTATGKFRHPRFIRIREDK